MEESSKGPSQERPASDAQAWDWRYKVRRRVVEADDAELSRGEGRVGTAWQQLQLVHTSYRHMDVKEYWDLSARLEAIERLFFDRPQLEKYYQQVFSPEDRPDLSGPTAPVFDDPEVRHVAAVQVQFLEDMFYVLQLDRHANAPDNRGWMNLFRRWGRSRTFNHWLDELRSTLTLGFLEFYDYYLRYHPCRVDEKPVPHPWDAEHRREEYRGGTPEPPPTRGQPGPCGEPTPGRPTERKRGVRPRPKFPGLFLDSGIMEAADPVEIERLGTAGVGTPGGGGPDDLKEPSSGQPGGSSPNHDVPPGGATPNPPA